MDRSITVCEGTAGRYRGQLYEYLQNRMQVPPPARREYSSTRPARPLPTHTAPALSAMPPPPLNTLVLDIHSTRCLADG